MTTTLSSEIFTFISSAMSSCSARSAACLLALISNSYSTHAYADAPASVYTALDDRVCKTVSIDPETGDRTARCPGMAGYSVLVQESDDRVSLTIISPRKQSFPLNFWDVAIPGFSTLGRELEWRSIVRDGISTPVGIVVRIDTVVQSDVVDPKPVSFLLVASVAQNAACVTAKIPAEQSYALLTARRIADDPNRRCLPSM